MNNEKYERIKKSVYQRCMPLLYEDYLHNKLCAQGLAYRIEKAENLEINFSNILTGLSFVDFSTILSIYNYALDSVIKLTLQYEITINCFPLSYYANIQKQRCNRSTPR